MNAFLEDLGKVYLEEDSIERKRLLIGSILPKKLVFRNGKLEPLGIDHAFELIKQFTTPGVTFSADERT